MQKNVENAALVYKKEDTEIVYQGPTFTVVKAWAEIHTRKTTEDPLKKRIIIAEGISRRSCLDSPNPLLGVEIATGRALRSLQKKLNGETIHNRFMG